MNEEQRVEKIIKAARFVSLEKHEKLKIRGELYLLTHLLEARKEMVLDTGEKSRRRAILLTRTVFAPRYLLWESRFLGVKVKQIFAAIAVLALLESGISYAAEGAVPGDALYSLKVNINERVRTWTALTERAKVETERLLAARRLEEAEKLAVAGRLNQKVGAALESNFKEHAGQVKKHIEALDEGSDFEAAAQASSNLETELRTHEAILSRLDTAGNLKTIKESVKKEKSEAIESRAMIDKKIKTRRDRFAHVAARKKLESVGEKIERARTSGVSSDNLAAADDAVAAGKEKLDEHAYGEAFALFLKAGRIIDTATLSQKAQKDLHVTVDVGEGDEKPNDQKRGSNDALVNLIETRVGELVLSFENGKATLKGELSRATPCIDWQVDTVAADGHIDFHIIDKNKSEICIQSLGRPQRILARADASPDTTYTVTLEDKKVFDGALSASTSGDIPLKKEGE